MKTQLRRSVAFLMTIILCVGLFVNLTPLAREGEVNYVYVGNYIKNWGVRDVVCTFLSPNAEAFYRENDITLDRLMSLNGSENITSVPSSELYKKLKDLMVSNHKHQTNYQETRPMYQYTDCQNSGLTGDAISSFYSGKEIGPAWDSGKTWNREHVWPNSKGLAGNDENDIMMLRPTSVSENSSRGNKAFGESSGYYNPNKTSNGAHNLHGDVARIVLYQYVRWSNTTYMWGSSGVIESKELLLRWMEEDPVDTWELGRNDSVEAITGTRNVFVDYPELAFALFNEQVPQGYQTPSGSALQNGYTVTVKASNNSYGSVEVIGNVITATPAPGYMVSGYKIVSGNASVTINGNTFTVRSDSDVTIEITFRQAPLFTLRFSENGNEAAAESYYTGQTITLPEHSGDVFGGYLFLGWSEQDVREGDDSPQYYRAGSSYTVTENVTFKALYAYQKDHGPTVYFTSYDTGCKHSDAYSTEKTDPTCTEAGREAGEFCPTCNAYISGGQSIDAIGHLYSNGCDTVCDVCGEDNNSIIQHVFNSDGICKECGVVQSEESDDESNIPDNDTSEDAPSESIDSESSDDSQQSESIDNSFGVSQEESVNPPTESSAVTSEAVSDESDSDATRWILAVIAGGILIAACVAIVVKSKSKTKSK